MNPELQGNQLERQVADLIVGIPVVVFECMVVWSLLAPLCHIAQLEVTLWIYSSTPEVCWLQSLCWLSFPAEKAHSDRFLRACFWSPRRTQKSAKNGGNVEGPL